MKKFLLFALLAVTAVFANAQETDVTTLDWTQKGQGCTKDFDNDGASLVFGTDAGGSNLSYVDISAYGQVNLYGTPGQRARLFVNREEIGDKGIIYVDINEEGVGVFDCNAMLTLQPTIQYIHLNGVKASAWDTKLNLSLITVSGDPIQFPEDVWICPEGETDVTTLAWEKKAQECTNNLGAMTDACVWGTDAGGTDISYVDLSKFGSIKVYGPAGQKARFFINREQYPNKYQFYADIDETGVGVLNLADVLAAQEGADHVYLNGIKAANWGDKLQINGITVVEAPWTCPEGEIDYITLGIKGDNNIGKSLNGGDVVCGDQSNGDNYTDVTEYDIVKFYGTPGAMLRIFANRAGGEGVTVGTTEQRVTIGEDGVGTLDIKSVKEATGKKECHLSGIKICATWQGATIDVGIKIKGITVVKVQKSLPEITLNSEGYATFSAAADAAIPAGVRAYKGKVKGMDIILTQLNGYIPAGTGVLLYGTPGKTVAFEAPEAEATAADVANNDFVATTMADGTAPSYTQDVAILALDREHSFVPFQGVELVANRAFITMNVASSKLRIVINDDATAIDNVTAKESRTGKMMENGEIVIIKNGVKYNVAGQLIK